VNWRPFRLQLKGKTRERVDQIFDAARTYADAGSMAVRLHTPDLVYMCALLSLMERIDQLESELEELKASSVTVLR
jgi:precorrin-4 methylase